ncbi:MAG: type II secretion system GspH family protein [Shewanella sp.]|nr:type II secretion system GspH family protein [Shewanella sp.]MCF1429498.1 type II secretion system GspH family protein [Shewanella sp.]MCF1438317.1 type II secretion system GspH family protein [Shewanella sp.]MCF1457682.1 type II secretion system GspH family protein [Shewanella sp.]
MQAVKFCGSRTRGFTLIELVVGMMVLAGALVMLSTMLFPQADHAADTLHRVRSAELGHSVMDEIWGKRYDDNTDPNGGTPCGTSSLPACTTVPGPDAGENRNDWDDIDDYNGMDQNSLMLNSSQTYADIYSGYGLQVTVTSGDASRFISVTVTTPSGEAISFNAVRSNY